MDFKDRSLVNRQPTVLTKVKRPNPPRGQLSVSIQRSFTFQHFGTDVKKNCKKIDLRNGLRRPRQTLLDLLDTIFYSLISIKVREDSHMGGGGGDGELVAFP
jgi:hypothetical protein